MKIHNWRDVKETHPMDGVTMRILCGPQEKAPTFVMRHFEFEPGAAMPYHAHPWEHEFFVLEGSGHIRTGKGNLPVKAGDAALVIPDEMHSVVNSGGGIMRIICLIPLVDGEMPVTPGVR